MEGRYKTALVPSNNPTLDLVESLEEKKQIAKDSISSSLLTVCSFPARSHVDNMHELQNAFPDEKDQEAQYPTITYRSHGHDFNADLKTNSGIGMAPLNVRGNRLFLLWWSGWFGYGVQGQIFASKMYQSFVNIYDIQTGKIINTIREQEPHSISDDAPCGGR